MDFLAMVFLLFVRLGLPSYKDPNGEGLLPLAILFPIIFVLPSSLGLQT